MKYLARSCGSTANPFTRPEVTAGPIERKRNPANVGVDIGSDGLSCIPPSGRCSPSWPPCCPPPLRADGVGVEGREREQKQNDQGKSQYFHGSDLLLLRIHLQSHIKDHGEGR